MAKLEKWDAGESPAVEKDYTSDKEKWTLNLCFTVAKKLNFEHVNPVKQHSHKVKTVTKNHVMDNSTSPVNNKLKMPLKSLLIIEVAVKNTVAIGKGREESQQLSSSVSNTKEEFIDPQANSRFHEAFCCCWTETLHGFKLLIYYYMCIFVS